MLLFGYQSKRGLYPRRTVLILVVVDVTFWGKGIISESQDKRSLNPCCSGCYFLGACTWIHATTEPSVLILVVVDVTFWDLKKEILKTVEFGLNPCCSGCYFLGRVFNTKENRLLVLILVVVD